MSGLAHGELFRGQSSLGHEGVNIASSSASRKIPHGGNQGSCIFVDSEDSDVDDTVPSSLLGRIVPGQHVPVLAPELPVDFALGGDSSLLLSLSKLTEQWTSEAPTSLQSLEESLGMSASHGSGVANNQRWNDGSFMFAGSRGSSTFNHHRPKDSSHRIVAGVTTTLMIRNIPLRFTPVSLRELIDSEGFMGHYDYFYMPMDFRSHRSLGYCFINFYDTDSTMQFAKMYENRRFASTNSEKILSVSAGARQGLLSNVASFKLSTLKQMPREEFRPVVAILGQLFPLDEEVYTWLLTGTSDEMSGGSFSRDLNRLLTAQRLRELEQDAESLSLPWS